MKFNELYSALPSPPPNDKVNLTPHGMISAIEITIHNSLLRLKHLDGKNVEAVNDVHVLTSLYILRVLISNELTTVNSMIDDIIEAAGPKMIQEVKNQVTILFNNNLVTMTQIKEKLNKLTSLTPMTTEVIH